MLDLPPPHPPPLAALSVASRYGMHVVVGNELHSRYDKVELVFPGGDERQIKKGTGAGVRRGRGCAYRRLLCRAEFSMYGPGDPATGGGKIYTCFINLPVSWSD